MLHKSFHSPVSSCGCCCCGWTPSAGRGLTSLAWTACCPPPLSSPPTRASVHSWAPSGCRSSPLCPTPSASPSCPSYLLSLSPSCCPPHAPWWPPQSSWLVSSHAEVEVVAEEVGEEEAVEGEEEVEQGESVFSPCHSGGVWVRTTERLWVSCKVMSEEFLSREENR